MALADYDRNPVTRGLETAERIKQGRARTTISQTAAEYAPVQAEQQQTLRDLAIQGGRGKNKDADIARERGTEQYDTNKMLNWLSLGTQSLPHIRNESEYMEWTTWMQEQGVPSQLIPASPQGASPKEFKTWLKSVTDASNQKALELQELRNKGTAATAQIGAASREKVAGIQAGTRSEALGKLSPGERIKVRERAYKAWQEKNMQFNGYDKVTGKELFETVPGAPEFNDKWINDYYTNEVAAVEGDGYDWRDY